MTSSLLMTMALSLTGCAKEVSTSFYGLNKYTRDCEIGDTVCKIDVSVNNGAITKASIEETYTPNVWARVSSSDLDRLETVKVTLDEGETRYYAKYIQIDNQVWVGSVRKEGSSFAPDVHHEYVTYSVRGASDEDANSDFLRYLSVQDTTAYKLGEEVNAYYNAVMNDKIKLLDDKNDVADDAEDPNYDFVDSGVKPSFPDGKKLRSENERFSSWKSSVDALCKFMIGRHMNYAISAKDDFDDTYDTLKAIDGEWAFNPSLLQAGTKDSDELAKIQDDDANWEKIEGCKVDDIKSSDALDVYFNGINEAYASLEYESIA